MKNKDIKDITIFDLLIETHKSLERQGPGSPEMTLRALSFVENLNENSRIADLGCGTGGQTMVLAQNTAGHITGVDMVPDFIDIFNNNAKRNHLEGRIAGIVGSAESLPFGKEELRSGLVRRNDRRYWFRKRIGVLERFYKKGWVCRGNVSLMAYLSMSFCG